MRVTLTIDIILPRETAMALLPEVSGEVGREAVEGPLSSAVVIYARRDLTPEESQRLRDDNYFKEEFS